MYNKTRTSVKNACVETNLYWSVVDEYKKSVQDEVQDNVVLVYENKMNYKTKFYPGEKYWRKID